MTGKALLHSARVLLNTVLAETVGFLSHKQHPKEVDLLEAVKELSIDESRPPPKYTGPLISIKDFLDAMAYVKPSALREIQIEVPKVIPTIPDGEQFSWRKNIISVFLSCR